jgi:hypothetical protein
MTKIRRDRVEKLHRTVRQGIRVYQNQHVKPIGTYCVPFQMRVICAETKKEPSYK